MKRLKNPVRPITLTATAAAITLLVAPALSPEIGDWFAKRSLPEDAKFIHPNEKAGAGSAVVASALSDLSPSSSAASLVHGGISGVLDPASGGHGYIRASPLDRQFGNLLTTMREASDRRGEEEPFGAALRKFLTLSIPATGSLDDETELASEFEEIVVKLDCWKSIATEPNAGRRRAMITNLLAAMDTNQPGEFSSGSDLSMVAISVNAGANDGSSGTPEVVWTAPSGSSMAGASTTGTSQAPAWYGIAPIASPPGGNYAERNDSPRGGSLISPAPLNPVMTPVWSNDAPLAMTVSKVSVSYGESSRPVSAVAPSAPSPMVVIASAPAVVSQSLVAAVPASGSAGAAVPSLAFGTLTTLYSFAGSPDGANPRGSLTLIGGTLYGTTSMGGDSSNDGTVFAVPVGGGSDTLPVTFANTVQGSNPQGSLLVSGGKFYGTTFDGGSDFAGSVFSVPVSGGTPTTLATFTDATNAGASPTGSLILNSGGTILYGTTSSGGGTSANGGTVFSLPVGGGTPTVLAKFPALTGIGGFAPLGSLILNSGGTTLYGTFSEGGNGSGSGEGEVFSLPVGGGTPTSLFKFDGTHGANPEGSLILVGGTTLYGTTYNGGANGDGTVFSLPVGGGTPTVLATFNGANGAHPSGSLLLIGSMFYGTTTGDGGADNDGTVFSLPLAGGTPTVLASFGGSNGEFPVGDLTLSTDGTTLYGTTEAGGVNSDGTVFSLVIAPEPSTWMMLACGIAVLGLTRRCRGLVRSFGR